MTSDEAEYCLTTDTYARIVDETPAVAEFAWVEAQRRLRHARRVAAVASATALALV